MAEMIAARRSEELEDSATATASAFDRINKATLKDGRGVTLREFKSVLTPRYGKVWFDLLGGHVALAAIVVGIGWAHAALPFAASIAIAVAGAILIGYVIAYIQLFFHEAAHYNIAPGRRLNDLLANLFIGVLVGQDIGRYRAIHFDHHRHLGTTRDTERSYFDPLTLGFMLESLTGIRVLKVLAVRRQAAPGPVAPTMRARVAVQLLVCLLLHGTLIGAAVWFRHWTAGAAWAMGVAVFFPFFGAVRKVLEHRSETARRDIDPTQTDLGAANRIFGDGPIARTLGGAGFNRHLLHHWEPQISYTRLKRLEAYLLDTAAADAVRARRTTYVKTFLALLRSNGRSA